jgi:hypothetical protein
MAVWTPRLLTESSRLPGRYWLSHFPELRTELVLLGSRHNADLTDDRVDALWT